MKIVLTFPVPISQIRDNAVEISVSPGGNIPLPELEIGNLEETCKALRISEEKAEQLLTSLQTQAIGDFLCAGMKHHLLRES